MSGIEPAKGFAKGLLRRLVVSFDDETFAEMRALAVKRRVSMASLIRELVEFGLLDTD
jgi:AmiR/NasT family two-component response regulator